MEIHDPTQIDHARVKLGMHSLSVVVPPPHHGDRPAHLLFHALPSLSWSNHGICGGGVFLDLVQYYTANGDAPPYDPWKTPPDRRRRARSVRQERQTFCPSASVSFKNTTPPPFFFGWYCPSSGRWGLFCVKRNGAGTEQSEGMKRFSWHARIFAPVEERGGGTDDALSPRNNHFAAVATDQPALGVCMCK